MSKRKKKKPASRQTALLRTIPSVSSLLEHDEVRGWREALPRTTIIEAIQEAIEDARRAINTGARAAPIDVDELLRAAEEILVERSMTTLQRVVNATGIVLHTGLGRAPLCESAIDAITDAASGYCSVEYELSTGTRGRRTDHVRSLLVSLTGAESATVVNNNAAATLMILKTFADRREAVVSRGQLVEIGGSFRLPDVFAASGAILHEVGTTNRTRITDYERAIGEQTALLMRVHPSNFRVVGFTEDVPIEAMAELAHRNRLLCVDDLGSGALIDFRANGLGDEPCVRDSITDGADLACFSGDKLVGGPQVGIIVGRKHLIDQLETHPLMRTYRVGKLTLLALEATLRHYLDPEDALERIPTLAMLRTDTDRLAGRARELIEQLESALPLESFMVCSDVGFAGGGAMPGQALQTVVVQWRPKHSTVDQAVRALREAEVPVVARIRDSAVCFDLRTLRPLDFESLVAAVCSALWDDDEAERDGMPLPVL